MDITVDHVRLMSSAGMIKALIDFTIASEIGNITIRGAKVIQQPEQRAWVKLPDREYADEAGQKRFAPVVTVASPLMDRISKVVLDAYGTARNSA